MRSASEVIFRQNPTIIPTQIPQPLKRSSAQAPIRSPHPYIVTNTTYLHRFAGGPFPRLLEIEYTARREQQQEHEARLRGGCALRLEGPCTHDEHCDI